MSRSFVRLMAGFALVAAPVVSAQAQVVPTPTLTCQVGVSGSCGVNFNPTFNVPVLASLTIPSGSVTLGTPNWTSFFTNPTATRTVSSTTFEVKSNSPYTVGISAAATWLQPSGAGREIADLTYTVAASCPAGADINGSLVGGGTLVASGDGAPTGGTTRTLCLALAFPGDLASNKLLPGDYTLPLTLTITAP